ncbi:MAG: VPLPA-CTERM sorting domain-containing protein [Gammaproteobacteria bacterium]|nr:VPLPA-CTERM sorting domain-containing protein [Gammaproteobacteria bacterium]
MIKIIFMFVLIIITPISNAATWSVLGGTMNVVEPTGGSPNDGVPVVFGGNGTFTDGVFDGSASAIGTDSLATNAGIELFQYLDIDLYTYFAPSGKDGEIDRLTGLSAPGIDLNTMTADMTSMFANWNSRDDYIGEYSIGGNATVTSLDEWSYELVWDSMQTAGPYQGMTVEMTMQVSAVPVPASVWLFGSGLLGLFSMSRRRLKVRY